MRYTPRQPIETRIHRDAVRSVNREKARIHARRGRACRLERERLRAEGKSWAEVKLAMKSFNPEEA